MKKYLNLTITKIGIVMTIIFGIIYSNNDYMNFEIRKCVVLNKLTTQGEYKSSGNFYLILKEERGIEFDLIVSPTIYHQSNIRDIKYFKLRNFDIKQTTRDNVIYFFGYIISGVFGFVFLIGGWVMVKISK